MSEAGFDPTTVYFNRMGTYEQLPPDEQTRLFEIWAETRTLLDELKDKPEQELSEEERSLILQGQDIRLKLITSNLRLVPDAIEKKVSRHKEYRNFDELVQIGNEWLIHAVDTFDPSLGYEFSTYAYSKMVPRMKFFLGESSGISILPRNIRQDVRKVYRAVRKLEETEGRAPSIEQIAEVTGFSRKRVIALREIREGMRVTSLDKPIKRGGKDGTLYDLVADALANPEQDLLRRVIEEAFSNLSERDAEILADRGGYGTMGYIPTLNELGERYGISYEAVRQAELKGKNVIRQFLAKHAMEIGAAALVGVGAGVAAHRRSTRGKVRTTVNKNSVSIKGLDGSLYDQLDGLPDKLQRLARLAFDDEGNQIRTPAQINEIDDTLKPRSISTWLSTIRRHVEKKIKTSNSVMARD